MGKVFSGSIAGKEIVNIDGMVLGDLEDVIFDVQTGKLVDLLVKPNKELNRMKYREDGRFVLIPFGFSGGHQGLHRDRREPGYEDVGGT